MDDSGSMYSGIHGRCFMEKLRVELDQMAVMIETHPNLDTSVDSVIFSKISHSSKRFVGMPNFSSTTNISTGFNEMCALVSRCKPEHCIIVFISDGYDDPGNEVKIQSLQPLACKSTLLTVAVGDGFPTSLVVDKLRPKYHTFGGDSIPLVIELPSFQDTRLEMESDVDWVIKQLYDIIISGGVLKEYTMEELEANPSVETISKQCKFWYNACTVKSVSKDIPHEEKLKVIRDTKEMFGKAEELMKGLSTMVKPLPSNLRAKRPLFLLHSMRQKLNKLLEQVENCRRVDSMTDVEKAEYLRHGNSEGRFMTKALSYHAAHFPTSLASLLCFLSTHKATVSDEELMDNINMCSWKEYFEDAARNMDLFKNVKSLAGVLDMLPFVGRAVRLYENQPDCCQINPWVLSSFVEELPMTLKGISTYDLHVKHQGALTLGFCSGNSVINALIVEGGDPACQAIFCHMQCFSFLKNWMLYFNDIRLVSASMLVLHVLCHYDKPQEWHLEELCRARAICALHSRQTAEWWAKYLDVLQCPVNFRKCLVTESDKLERFLTCPGLGKFMLGTWWLVDQGVLTTKEELAERCRATLVEFFGRCKLTSSHFFTLTRQFNPFQHFDMEALIHRALGDAMQREHLTCRKMHVLLKTAMAPDLIKAKAALCHGTCIHFEMELLKNCQRFHLSFYGIHCFFKRLVLQATGKEWEDGLDGDESMMMRLLLQATMSDNSYQRCHSQQVYDGLSKQNMMDQMACKLAGSGVKHQSFSLILNAMEIVISRTFEQHQGLPRVMPAEYMARYKEESQGLRDIAHTWKVDSNGLSRVACCFPDCSLYLVIPKASTEKKQRAIITNHLHMCCKYSIPGLHNTIAKHLDSPTDEIINLIKTGADLHEPFLPREVTRRMAKGLGVYGGVPSRFAHVDAYRADAVQTERLRLRSKILAAMPDDATLGVFIDNVKRSMHGAFWSYDEFKATFDALYR